MNKHYRKLLALVAVLTAFITGAGIAWWVASSVPAQRSSLPQRADTESERTVLYWYDPMYPHQRFDQPGKSPFMDMALVPKYAEASDPAATVSVDARVSPQLGQDAGEHGRGGQFLLARGRHHQHAGAADAAGDEGEEAEEEEIIRIRRS